MKERKNNEIFPLAAEVSLKDLLVIGKNLLVKSVRYRMEDFAYSTLKHCLGLGNAESGISDNEINIMLKCCNEKVWVQSIKYGNEEWGTIKCVVPSSFHPLHDEVFDNYVNYLSENIESTYVRLTQVSNGQDVAGAYFQFDHYTLRLEPEVDSHFICHILNYPTHFYATAAISTIQGIIRFPASFSNVPYEKDRPDGHLTALRIILNNYAETMYQFLNGQIRHIFDSSGDLNIRNYCSALDWIKSLCLESQQKEPKWKTLYEIKAGEIIMSHFEKDSSYKPPNINKVVDRELLVRKPPPQPDPEHINSKRRKLVDQRRRWS